MHLFYLTYICVCVLGVCVAYLWRSEDSLQELLTSLYRVDLGLSSDDQAWQQMPLPGTHRTIWPALNKYSFKKIFFVVVAETASYYLALTGLWFYDVDQPSL